ncbi:MAG: hypothetical protein AAFY63_00020 [Cyanobacteria bacterium J06643_13]
MNQTILTSALLSLIVSNISPVNAQSQSFGDRLQADTSYSQNSSAILLAGFGDFVKGAGNVIKDGTEAVRDVDSTIQDMEDRNLQQREREQALQERQRREEELVAARKAATERQIQEAERRRQYFDSLSPEEKQAYINQQQAVRKQQAEANLLMLGLFADFLIGGSSDSGNSGSQSEYVYVPNNSSSTSTNNPAPRPVKPIHPHYDCPSGC